LTGYQFWNVVGDMFPYRNATNHPGTLQITPSDYTADLDDHTHDWLMMGGFFNLSDGYE